MRKYLLKQIELHPSIRPRDVVKMCYQATFGAEHLLFDTAKAREMFFAEFDAVKPSALPLFEQISPDFCRVNLAAWKKNNLDGEWLFKMFLLTAATRHGTDEELLRCLESVKDFLLGYGEEYLSGGIRAVHHSEEYRAAECPSYRVVSMRLTRLIPILQLINSDTKVIAIDGRAASGKSTAAKALCEIIGAADVHMDDFFLPPECRTSERLAELGGNVHYERFAKEVLPHLRSDSAFEYRVFDCSKMKFDGVRHVKAAKICVVEGAYSHHKSFGDYADIKVFSTVENSEQMRRIIARNGEKMAKMFEEKWIPMEEAYFEKFKIKENSDVVI
ncbi:MAG: hypothetical protein E7598_03405 [Ruminococcaceae bacterium]|nr:hypothetical protein [Oscillospiraceae bacterium]